jgi:hypothetical protein
VIRARVLLTERNEKLAELFSMKVDSSAPNVTMFEREPCQIYLPVNLGKDEWDTGNVSQTNRFEPYKALSGQSKGGRPIPRRAQALQMDPSRTRRVGPVSESSVSQVFAMDVKSQPRKRRAKSTVTSGAL